MKVGILQFPGSNCDDDSMHVITRVLKEEAQFVWHKENRLPAGTDAVIVPGGFSYGDYLRAGAIAAHSPIMDAVRVFAAEGGAVLGICNGFQILCESGLLPGALTRNASLRFECRQVYVRAEGKPTPFTAAIPAGRVLRMPIAHAEGRYFSEDAETFSKRGQVVFRYCDAAGSVVDSANPNGSQLNIAGIANEAGNVMALMPHPERASEPLLGEDCGRQLFESLRTSIKDKKVGKKSGQEAGNDLS
jgi:phosphoribosylformylglycinamidine synthase subunit PurQ / glutaminase